MFADEHLQKRSGTLLAVALWVALTPWRLKANL